MGKGRFIGTGLDLYVSLDFNASAFQNEVEDVFGKLSERFFQASDGQLHIANILWSDGGLGRNVADMFFLQDANNGVLGQAMLEGLGTYGAWMEVFGVANFNPTKNDSLAFAAMHELGHYIWGLGDEYAGPVLTGPLDSLAQQAYENQNTPPYRRLYLAADFDILNPATNQDYDMLDCEVDVLLNNSWVTGIANAVSVLPGGVIELRFDFGAGFSQGPSTSTEDVRIRPVGICGAQGQNFCVMNGRGGDESRREFCGAGNHDPNRSTMQSARHNGLDCWEVIADKMSERWDVVIPPALFGDPNTGAAPAANIEKLLDEQRYVLVLDRSGSMDEDEKIEGARGGLEFWIDSAQAQGEFLGIVWFNSGIETAQALENVAAITNIEQVKDNVLSLPPEGGTNIKDALDQAADMLISESNARGPAAVQYIVLMTDGEHNVPPPSTVALEPVPKCQEHGIQIFTLGLGSSENVDTTVLEQLAYQTSGRPYMGAIDTTGQNQDMAVFEALYRLNLELGGDFAAEVELNIDELLANPPLDERMRKWSQEGKRPPIKALLEVTGASDLDELVKDQGRFVTTSMWVEEGAHTASFGVSFPRKQPVWLYLIDPDGKELSEVEVKPFKGRYPYEAAIIKKPKRGQWTILLVRPEPGPAFRVHFKGGIENRNLVVSGDCDKIVPLGSAANIWANAYWDGDLSAIHMQARLRDPEGGVHTVILNDDSADDPFSGDYMGAFTPTMNGRYEGEIRIINKGEPLLADGIDRLAHLPFKAKEDGARLDLRLKRDRFKRMIRIYFDAGTRRPPKDKEKAAGILAKDRANRRPKRPRKQAPLRRVAD